MGQASVAVDQAKLVEPTSRSRELWRAAIVLYATAIVQAAIFVALPSSSDFFRSLGLAETTYGALFLPMLGVATVSSLVGPRIARRWSLRTFYRVGLLCDVVMLVSLALAPVRPSLLPWILGFGAFVLGIALGWMGIALNATAMSMFPRARGAALSALHAAVGLGATFAPILVRAACDAGRWHWFSLLLASCCILLFVLESLLWRIPFPGAAAVPDVAADAPRFSGNAKQQDLRAAGGAFLYGVAEATIASWAVLFLTGKGLSGSDAARALSAFWLAVTLGRIGAAPLLRVLSPGRMAVGLVALQFASFFVIGTVRTSTHAIVAYALAGLGASALFPIVLSLATRDSRASLARTTAVVTAGLMIGLGTGAFLVGPLSRVMPMESVFRASAIWPLLLLVWLGRGRER